MSYWRKKPIVIEAVQWDGTGNTTPALLELSDYQVAVGMFDGRSCFEVYTKEGTMRGEVGDWLIKGIAGELYPCKPDIFAATYEPAPWPQSPTAPQAAETKTGDA